MRYTCAVFDMDGTILDTLDDLRTALNRALRISGYPERTRDEVRRFVGNGVKMLIRRAAPQDITEDRFAKLLSDFREWYNAHASDETRPYAGIREAIASLRAAGIKTAVVSNKSDEGVRILCAEFFGGMFDVYLGVTEETRPKPAPDLVRRALDLLGAEPSQSVYIGDTEVDVQTAANSGLDFIGVLWGFRGRETLTELGVTELAEAPAALPSMILSHPIG